MVETTKWTILYIGKEEITLVALSYIAFYDILTPDMELHENFTERIYFGFPCLFIVKETNNNYIFFPTKSRILIVKRAESAVTSLSLYI